jgi:acetyl esterase/lipase
MFLWKINFSTRSTQSFKTNIMILSKYFKDLINKLIVFLLLMSFSISGFTQTIFRLYEGKAPGSEDWNYKEINYTSTYKAAKLIRNVVDPTIELFAPDKSKATGTTVIVCPGGGNFYLEYDKEGTQIAKWLAKNGITAFVLKYRLNKTPEDTGEFRKYQENFNSRMRGAPRTGTNPPAAPPAANPPKYFGGEDGVRAIEYVREHAAQFKVDPKKVGIMGFSAGGMVAAYTLLNSKEGKLPDFAAPIYGGSIYGLNVPSFAPPIFVACAADDVLVTRSLELFKAWKDAGKSAELHIYSKGGHGFGILPKQMPVDTWIERFYEWMKFTGF